MTSHRCKLLTWRRTGAVTDGVHCHVWWLWDFLFILWLGVVMNDTGCVWLYLSFRLRLWNIPGFCRKMEAQTCMSESQYLVVFTKSWACVQLESFCLPSFFFFLCQLGQSEDISRQDRGLLCKESLRVNPGQLWDTSRSAEIILTGFTMKQLPEDDWNSKLESRNQ